MSERIPLVAVPAEFAGPLAARGGRPINLYRALANNPVLLQAWIDMAWTLRSDARTPRGLRELMIVRGSLLCGCHYELEHHRRMAAEAGVSEEELAALGTWTRSDLFSEPERAALAFMEEMVALQVTDATTELLKQHFTDAERVELALTAGFYSMVPRVLDALGVPLEHGEG